MKTKGCCWLVGLLLGVCLFGFTQQCFSQFSPPTVIGASVTNVGGMCYVSLTFTNFDFTCCTDITTVTPVTRTSATNLYMKLNEGYIPGCLSFPECIPQAITRTFVLGNLDPGKYLLTTEWAPSLAQRIGLLDVPAPTTNTPMLAMSQTNGGFAMNVAGIPNVRYVVQSSVDFTSWTSLSTNVGAPFTFNLPVPTSDACYFRVQLSQTH